ncbi:hypothetical protein CSV86_021485 [Pseudomonas putida CSV86]|uniref:Delta-60 repeat domain-containing protein n=1 Tax=Pseudomonas bharatica CSV86 TaxID=1005395 RepID=A0A7K4EIV7_9PSED|nr:hypothetical protein [Pseudomonas bharatica]NNJ17574.1 hypothetical protein [Pseudomonas bharatica CSV86]
MNAPQTTRNPGDLDVDFGFSGRAPFPPAMRSGKSKLLGDRRILSACSDTVTPMITMARHLWTGDLDVSYGPSGLVHIQLPEGPAPNTANLVELLVLPDDSALVYGALRTMDKEKSFVFRVLPNGELDSAFGVDGFCILDFGDQSAIITALELLDDGKIMACVISHRTTAPAFHGSYLVRLDNGVVDTTFGDNGMGYVEASNHPLRHLAVSADGGYLLAGRYDDLGKAEFRQYHADGSPDLAFGENGQVLLPLPPGQAEILQVKVQTDGRIVGVGMANVGFGNHTLTTRLNPDGSLDSTFNNGEPKIMVFQGHETQSTGVDFLPDGKIVTAGYTTYPIDVILMRMEPNGMMDMSFGINGQVISDLGGQETREGVEVQDDGKILASGRRITDLPFNHLFLARYLG